jgi:DNA-binding CsgD family transcriptional regulator
MENDLRLIESLLAVKTETELWRAGAAISQHLGCEHFMYGLRTAMSLTRPSEFSLFGSPKEWVEHYQSLRYERIDPVVQHCRVHIVPALWGSHLFSSRAAVTLYQEAAEYGLKSGVSFPVHGPAVEVALVSLITSKRHLDSANFLGKAQLFSCYLHEAYRKLSAAEQHILLAQKPLTDREKQCLLWAAVGKSSWETAVILNIAERTAVFHLTNAAAKLGAVNRRQAVARAIALGLIAP